MKVRKVRVGRAGKERGAGMSFAPGTSACGPFVSVAPGTKGAIAEALRLATPYSTILLQRGVYQVRWEGRIAGLLVLLGAGESSRCRPA